MSTPSKRARAACAFASIVATFLAGCGGSTDGPGASAVAVTLGSQGNEPNGLAVYGTEVYWASVDWQSDAGPSGTGSVQAISADGGGVTVLGTGVLPSAVAVDGTSVYWTDSPASGSIDILRTPRAGGATSVLAMDQQMATGIVVDATSIYWVVRQGTSTPVPMKPSVVIPGSQDALLKMPLGGGPPVTLATSSATNGLCVSGCIAVDATSVYWASSDSVLKVPLAGGSPVSLASTSGATSLAVAPAGCRGRHQRLRGGRDPGMRQRRLRRGAEDHAKVVAGRPGRPQYLGRRGLPPERP